jgi:hypothetical protein
MVGVIFSRAEKSRLTIKVDAIEIELVIQNDMNIKPMLFSTCLVKTM